MSELVPVTLEQREEVFQNFYFNSIFGTLRFCIVDPRYLEEDYDLNEIKLEARNKEILVGYNIELPDGTHINFSEKGKSLGVVPVSTLEGDLH